jgi:hypothetical protein
MTDGTAPVVRRRRRPILALGAVVAMVMAIVTGTTGIAHADVDRVAGSATPLNIGGTVPSPTVSGSAAEPTDGYGPIGSGLLQSGVQCPSQGLGGVAPVPLVISVGLLEACTQGAGVAGDNHLGFSESSASVANVVLGTTNLGVVTSECRADGNGARGSSTIVGQSGLPTNPLPNTLPQLPAGLLSLVLNEQIVNNTAGTATITVNAVHANILGIDIIISQSVCEATGPNVNVTTTTTAGTTTTGPTVTTTQPPGTTTTTACPPAACPTTTVAPTTTTACPPVSCPTPTTACPPATCPTTTAPRCPTPTCPTPTTTCPTPTPACPAPTPQCPTPTPACPTATTIKVGALVRTGSDNDLKVAWAAMALTLGGLFLMGSKGMPGQAAPSPASGHTPTPAAGGRHRSRREMARDIFREMRRFK